MIVFPQQPSTIHPARHPAHNPNQAAFLPDLDTVTLGSVKTVQPDDVDRQLLHALTVAPRASFRLLAEVVGVSDQTIARRYRRLTARAGLRVVGLVDGERVGWVDWLIRLQATPGTAQRIADALASRPDTRWVRLYSGGTEIICTVQTRSPEQRNALLLRGLPGSRHVTAITAHSILHVFTPTAWVGYTSALSAAQLATLREAVPDTPPPPQQPAPPPGTADAWSLADATVLRSEDEPLLAELARDGRTPIADLAAATHWHESTVRRRLEELQRAGLLYFDMDIDDSYLGVSANLALWLKVEPAHLEAAGCMIAAHPEVPFAAAITGPANLAVTAVFRDTRQLYTYLTTRLAAVPGLQSVESAPIIGTVKKETRVEELLPLGSAFVPSGHGGAQLEAWGKRAVRQCELV
jgi:DNA-binding Lrp family transcriptional regulator